MSGAVSVFVVEQQDEVWMRGEMVERTLDQFLDRPLGGNPSRLSLRSWVRNSWSTHSSTAR